MKRANTRVCPVCGTGFSAGLKFCPVCMLSMGLRGESKSAENSPEIVRSASVAELSSQRFEHPNFGIRLDSEHP